MKNTTNGMSLSVAAMVVMAWAMPSAAQIDLGSEWLDNLRLDFEKQPALPLSTSWDYLEENSSAIDLDDENVRLAKGGTAWTVAGNLGLSHGGRFTRKFGSLALGVERGVTDVVGPPWLRGRLAASIELLPAYVLSQESTTYAVGFNLLGRHYLETRGSIRPFITFGAGMLVSEEEIPTGTANLNFTPQLGAGIAVTDVGGHIFTVEYRIHHLSNGGRVDPNPGMNSSLLQFGVTFLRGT